MSSESRGCIYFKEYLNYLTSTDPKLQQLSEQLPKEVEDFITSNRKYIYTKNNIPTKDNILALRKIFKDKGWQQYYEYLPHLFKFPILEICETDKERICEMFKKVRSAQDYILTTYGDYTSISILFMIYKIADLLNIDLKSNIYEIAPLTNSIISQTKYDAYEKKWNKIISLCAHML